MDAYSTVNSQKKTITISIMSNKKTHKLKYVFKQTSTIYDIKVAFKDEVHPDKDLSKMVLRKSGTELDNLKTLKYYGITRNKTLSMSTRLRGGAQALISPKRIMDLSDGDITLTNDKCCMLLIDSNNIQRAKMLCGCGISADGMMGWIKKIYGDNESNFKIFCPSHSIEWDWDLCCKVAGMTDIEYDKYDGIHELRSSPPEKECPTCDASCERPDNLKQFRINCPDCNGGDWCWNCGNDWIGGGFTVCGNSGCVTAEINDTLKSCPLKNLGKDYGFVKVPEVRACIFCYVLIEHEKACKHMTCPECKKKFCFSCLKGKDANGVWPCGNYDYLCPVAPRQQLK